jgi:hypothetical protein
VTGEGEGENSAAPEEAEHGDGPVPTAREEEREKERWQRALEADTLDAIEKDGGMLEASGNPLHAWRALDSWFTLNARRRDAGLDPLPIPDFCASYFRVLARRLVDTTEGLDWTVAPEPFGFLPSPQKAWKDQDAEERKQSTASLRRAKERERIKDPARAAKLAEEALALWSQGKNAFAKYWRAQADVIAAMSVEMFQTAEAMVKRSEDGTWSTEAVEERITEPKAIKMLAEADANRRTRRRGKAAVEPPDPADVARAQRRRVSRGRALQTYKVKNPDGLD